MRIWQTGDFPSITTIYACDGQADDGTLLNCEDAYPGVAFTELDCGCLPVRTASDK